MGRNTNGKSETIQWYKGVCVRHKALKPLGSIFYRTETLSDVRNLPEMGRTMVSMLWL